MQPEVSEQRRRRRPQPGRFIAGTVVLAACLFVLAWILVGPPHELLALVVLCALGTLSQALRESNIGQRVTLSFLSIVQIASIPLVGPVGAATVGGLSQALDVQRTRPVARLFNLAMNICLGVVGGGVYLLAKGVRALADMQSPEALVVHVAAPLVLADAVQMTVNALLIAGIVHADRGTPFRVTFFGMINNSGVAYVGYGVIAFLFVVLWLPAGVGPFSAVLILAPLFVARWAIVQYGDEVRSHESALSALVTAVETKDPFVRGHSERVAQLVDWLAEPLSLSSQQASALRFAALLHDIGRVGLPARLIRGADASNSDDLRSIAEHADKGADLLRGVTFLEDSIDGVRQHHERWDGRGYPRGLQGEDICVIARVIAVADAFDSLTTERPGRKARDTEGALTELVARAGAQFDPAVVKALSQVLERRTWTPGVVGDEEVPAMSGYFDHDDPQASDLYARLVADLVGQPISSVP